MPALTVKSVSKSLSEYVRTDEDIVAKLNLVMPRIYALGMWRDLIFDYQISTTNDYFALPEHAESLLGVLLQDSPVDAQSQWHDYRISGYANDGPSPLYGVIDDGFHPSKQDFPSDDKFFQLKVIPADASPSHTLPLEGSVNVKYDSPQVFCRIGGTTSPSVQGDYPVASVVSGSTFGGSIPIHTYDSGETYPRVVITRGYFASSINYYETSGDYPASPSATWEGLSPGDDPGDPATATDWTAVSGVATGSPTTKRVEGGTTTSGEHTFTMDGSGSLVSPDLSASAITEIRFDGLHQKVRLVAENFSDDTEQYTLAEMIGDGVVRYRRFRFQNSSAATKDVKLLLKRSWQPLVTENDIIHLGNLNAIKHGLLGMLAEDNADLERAQYHWTICQQLLDQELDAARGAAKPKLKLNPAGAGVNFNIPNIV